MDREVVTIPAEQVSILTNTTPRILRVAAYCRVSTDEERQLESFENQIEYFTDLIQKNSKYEFVRIYSDEGISGTSIKRRNGFQTMIHDCEARKIDLIITKSISRFARNTQDSLNFTRKLKDMGIGVYFEKEGINTLESSGELLLTLFSCFAQEESRSISENTAWGIRSKFRQGIPHINADLLLGYDKDPEGKLIINEDQAIIVRHIYRSYLEGYSLNGIARSLNQDGIKGVHGQSKWCGTTVSRILQNEKYKGSLLMQKTYTSNYLTKQHLKNTGQLNQYYIENDHPAIIPPEEWTAVQEEIERRKLFRAKHKLRGLDGAEKSPFSSKLFCERCAVNLNRVHQSGSKKPRWQCPECGIRIYDDNLRELFVKAFNALVLERDRLVPGWQEAVDNGTALEAVRAKQISSITEEGTIPFEIPQLTQAVLEEVILKSNLRVRFLFLSGDKVETDVR